MSAFASESFSNFMATTNACSSTARARANCPRFLLSHGSPESEFLDISVSRPPSRRGLSDPRP